MTSKIMNRDSLDKTLGRLICCAALFDVLCADIADGEDCTDALDGAIDLLKTITRDFEADIAAAEDHDGEAGTA